MPAIHEWPESMRPRERLAERGAGALSDAELLAILIGSGRPGKSAVATAQSVLEKARGMRGLVQLDHTQLRGLGIGPATAIKVAAAREFARRTVTTGLEGDVIGTPDSAARALQPYFAHLDREEVKVALLSRKHRLLGVVDVYAGNVAGTSVRIGELFTEAIRRNAPAIVLGHNHPSGDPTPSADDLRTTRDAVAAGRLLGIDVLDHVVFGAGRWISLGARQDDRTASR
ncbi:MAG: DNA repair protein RadC [Chloroflexi bacterium]|nr:DNA repair protein RadC [Chloroflexota bacterium]MBI2983383.1 DNA repair protein RadC [Chloroflexota bacterium]